MGRESRRSGTIERATVMQNIDEKVMQNNAKGKVAVPGAGARMAAPLLHELRRCPAHVNEGGKRLRVALCVSLGREVSQGRGDVE